MMRIMNVYTNSDMNQICNPLMPPCSVALLTGKLDSISLSDISMHLRALQYHYL
jgi:hypothetical protein